MLRRPCALTEMRCACLEEEEEAEGVNSTKGGDETHSITQTRLGRLKLPVHTNAGQLLGFSRSASAAFRDAKGASPLCVAFVRAVTAALLFPLC